MGLVNDLYFGQLFYAYLKDYKSDLKNSCWPYFHLSGNLTLTGTSPTAGHTLSIYLYKDVYIYSIYCVVRGGSCWWGVEHLVSDIVRACGQVCTCASNTVMRATFAGSGSPE